MSTGQDLPRRSWRQAFRFAVEGLRYAVRTQRTLRTQLLITAAIGGLLIWLRLPLIDTAIVILALAMVLAAELFNTGAEAIADLLVANNQHHLAKLAKDVAAGAVLVAVVAAALVGGVLLGPPLIVLMGFDAEAAGRIARVAAVLVALFGPLLVLGLRGRPAGKLRAQSPDFQREPQMGAPFHDRRPTLRRGSGQATDDRYR